VELHNRGKKYIIFNIFLIISYITQLLLKKIKFKMIDIDKSEKNIRLSDLKKGDEGRIESFNNNDASLTRLRDLGLHDGIAFRVVKFAPLGDPIEIKIRGFYLSIRKSLAKQIIIKKK